MNDAIGRTWPAPAKLNLFLHVTGRRPDGYHDLQTLFQLLDWGDEVTITPGDDSAIRRAGGGYGVSEDDDLVVRAARLLQQETGSRLGATLQVHKQVPLGSGMGGGSSDAATVLLVLNRLWKCGLDENRLARMGAALGADVPVFIRGASALAGGIGERLQAVNLGERHYVVVFPGVAIPTREIFEDPLLKRDSAPYAPGEHDFAGGRNDCEDVVRRRYPAVDEVFEKLRPWGRPRLTGTGSAVFLEVADAARAEATAQALKSLYNSRAVRGVDLSPLHQLLHSDGV